MKPKFPRRVKQHVSETASLKLLKAQIPNEWIVRDLGERDYGTDLVIEIVRDGVMSGDIIVGQLKGVRHDPLRGKATFRGMSVAATNYLLHQPAPAFLFVASQATEQVYWRSLRDHHRNLSADDKFNEIKLIADLSLSEVGLMVLNLVQRTEREWHRVEQAVISALVFFTSFGPLVLGCRRYPANKPIPSGIQQLLISHFLKNGLIQRYCLKSSKRYPSMPEIYDSAFKAGQIIDNFQFSGRAACDFLDIFLRDYVEAIELCDNFVRKVQRRYWKSMYSFEIAHIDALPPYFIDEDWYSRYYFDEYENETRHINLNFFADIPEETRGDFVDI